MVDQTVQTQITQVPEYISDRQQQVLNTLYGVQAQGDEFLPDGTTPNPDYVPAKTGLLQLPSAIPQQLTAGLSPAQIQAMQMQQQGIGAYQPFLDAATQTQAGALGTVGQGIQSLQGMNLGPGAYKQYMDPYQQDVTNEALKEIDRQSAMAGNQLAGKAVQAGAFGGSRFGLQQSELARNSQDLKSRRIFEDLSRNYQQAQASAQAANTQRLQQGQQFGNLGKITSGIGGAMAGLGGSAQQMGQSDVQQLLGIGGLQQQQAQQEYATDFQNLLAQEKAPFEVLGAGANILQQLSPQTVGQQTISPMATTNPFAQAAGIVGTGVGLRNLMG